MTVTFVQHTRPEQRDRFSKSLPPRHPSEAIGLAVYQPFPNERHTIRGFDSPHPADTGRSAVRRGVHVLCLAAELGCLAGWPAGLPESSESLGWLGDPFRAVVADPHGPGGVPGLNGSLAASSRSGNRLAPVIPKRRGALRVAFPPGRRFANTVGLPRHPRGTPLAPVRGPCRPGFRGCARLVAGGPTEPRHPWCVARVWQRVRHRCRHAPSDQN